MSIKHYTDRVVTVEKNPGSILTYELDYTKLLARSTPADTISTSVWAVDPAGDLAIDSSANDTEKARVTVSGGAALGDIYWLKNTITCASGQQHIWNIRVRIAHKIVPPFDDEEEEYSWQEVPV